MVYEFFSNWMKVKEENMVRNCTTFRSFLLCFSKLVLLFPSEALRIYLRLIYPRLTESKSFPC